MKKYSSFLSVFTLLLIIASLAGCKSPGRNPAGVYVDGMGGEFDMIGGGLAVGNRFTGGSEHIGVFAPVLFAYDSSQVGASERGKIEAVGSHLKQNAAHAVIVEGHCDERGSSEYNLALGEQRALAIRSYLAGLGIESDRIQTKSMGEEMPAVPGHDEGAWSQNRRGEFVLYY